MKNIISYVLYGQRDRYWHPIPFVLATTRAVYPDFTLRFYIHPDAQGTPGCELLFNAREAGLVEIEEFSRAYSGKDTTFPCLERLRPLWEKDSGYVLCRDLDACPSSAELRAVRTFMRTGHSVHGLRSYAYHTAPLMGGLVGFNTPKILKKIPTSFETFLYACHRAVSPERQKDFGTDLIALELVLANLLPETLDTRVGSAGPIPYPSVKLPQNVYDETDMSDLSLELLALLDSLVEWPGKPLKIPNESLWKALELILDPMSLFIRKSIQKNMFGEPWRL